jgi:hypothetical protein
MHLVRLSTRYGLVGIGALSLLSLVHCLRDITAGRQFAADYLLGVTPNFAAAIAITFVVLSIWADQNPDAIPTAATRAFLFCALISGLGLLGWEFLQKTSNRFVFDPHDVGATMIGIGMAIVLFHRLTPRRAANIRPEHHDESKTDHSG